MTKRVYTLATSIIGGCASIASAIVTFCQPAWATAIVAAIGIGSTAVIEILQLFVKDE